MILVVLKIQIRPERREDWLAGIKGYTAAVRGEPGNISFDCFESLDTENQFAIVEGFESREAGDAHVKTAHFSEFMGWFPGVIAGPPEIVNVELPGDGWTVMSELG